MAIKQARTFGMRVGVANITTPNNPASSLHKIELRRQLLETIGPQQAHVFDAYAGTGELYSAVWRHAASYVGCDKTWYRDERKMFAADNGLVMRAVDLERWNIFDFDAYGGPWHLAYILACRRRLAPRERIGLALTEGSALKMKLGGMPHVLAQLAGINPRACRGIRQHPMIINLAIERLAGLMQARVTQRWEAMGLKHQSAMRYMALVLEGLPGTRQPERRASAKARSQPVIATGAAS